MDIERKRGEYRATLADYAAALGIGPDDRPPPSVADAVMAFGPNTSAQMSALGFEPEALRWLSIIHRFWADRLAEAADLSEAETERVLTEAWRWLRGGAPSQYAQGDGEVPPPRAE